MSRSAQLANGQAVGLGALVLREAVSDPRPGWEWVLGTLVVAGFPSEGDWLYVREFAGELCCPIVPSLLIPFDSDRAQANLRRRAALLAARKEVVT